MSEDQLPPLESLQASVQDARQKAGLDEDDARKAPDGRSVAMRMVMDLAAGALVGALMGWWLDEQFGTRPMLLLACLLFGTVGGFLNMYRTAQRYVEATSEENSAPEDAATK